MGKLIDMFDGGAGSETLATRESKESGAFLGRAHLAKRSDRVKKYLLHRLEGLEFCEFSHTYLDRASLADDLSGVPVPLRGDDMAALKDGGEIKSDVMAENMARVFGADPVFKYADAYSAYINKVFAEDSVRILTGKPREFADKGEYEDACVFFRAALVLKYGDPEAMYGYARALMDLYGGSDDEKYTGCLKAEALDFFELLTELHPDFGQGWYYLGYMYINLGLYLKAKLAWEKFLAAGGSEEERSEIAERMEQLKTPILIEKGCNEVLAGRCEDGLRLLEPYKDGDLKEWWPLWYYLGMAYSRLGMTEDAEAALKKTLRLSPRNTDAMSELIAIYEALGDSQMVMKYTQKIALIRSDEAAAYKAENGGDLRNE